MAAVATDAAFKAFRIGPRLEHLRVVVTFDHNSVQGLQDFFQAFEHVA